MAADEKSTLKLFFDCRFHTLHARVPTQKVNEIVVSWFHKTFTPTTILVTIFHICTCNDVTLVNEKSIVSWKYMKSNKMNQWFRKIAVLRLNLYLFEWFVIIECERTDKYTNLFTLKLSARNSLNYIVSWSLEVLTLSFEYVCEIHQSLFIVEF
jgi:hypothetical protein